MVHHTINFHRFDRHSQIENFHYKTNNNIQEVSEDLRYLSMDGAGLNVHYSVKNYLAETVMIAANLRSNPTCVRSLRRDDVRPQDNVNNFVVVTIYSTENTRDPDPKKRTVSSTKTEIRIPGRMLNQGSVFITELDSYLTTESQLEATRVGMSRDITQDGWNSLNLPASMVNQDPAVKYVEYQDLVKQCLDHQDRIQVRVGHDLRYGKIPDIIKNMRISILDSYFNPFTSNKMVYDPSLNPDDFVIENIYPASRAEYQSTFSELDKVGSVYLDRDERSTLFGKFFGLALFKSREVHEHYVYKRKAQERFHDEELYVAERSGDPLLREEIDRLRLDAEVTREILEDKTTQITDLTQSNKRLKATLSERDDTIKQIKDHRDSRMSADAVLGEIANDSAKIELESRKIDHDRQEQYHKENQAPLVHHQTTMKIMADMMKSTWGIITAIIGGIAAIAALMKKYNIHLVMG